MEAVNSSMGKVSAVLMIALVTEIALEVHENVCAYRRLARFPSCNTQRLRKFVRRPQAHVTSVSRMHKHVSWHHVATPASDTACSITVLCITILSDVTTELHSGELNPEGEISEAPPYMLTESLSAQKLWHQTAGASTSIQIMFTHRTVQTGCLSSVLFAGTVDFG